MVKNIKSKIVGSCKPEKQLVIKKKMETEAMPGNGANTPRTAYDKIKTHQSFSQLSLNIKRESQKIQVLPPPPVEMNIDMFEIGRKLGKGRFGDVYMARDRKTGFAFAIKVINKK